MEKIKGSEDKKISDRKMRILISAQRELEKFIKKGDKKARNDLGYIFFEQGKYEEAKKQFKLAVEAGILEANYGLCLMAYRVNGDFEEAEKYALSALPCGIKKIIKVVHYDIGDAFLKQDKLDKGLRHPVLVE